MVKRPTFTISMDTELAWGYALHPDSKVLLKMSNDDSCGRWAIDTLLSIFDKYDLQATWAIVGHLFLDHCRKEECLAPKHIRELEGENYDFDPGTDINRAPLYYGRDIIEKILSSKVEHEIGYHSFSHIPFSDCSQEAAEAEIEKGVELASKMGISLRSFVFPQEKIGHIDILKKYGFRVYRGVTVRRRSSSKNFLVRLKNAAINEMIADPIEPRWLDGIMELPASMYFCDPLFPFTLLPRAKRGIKKAIKENKIFHVWLHPHNLIGSDLAGKLEELVDYIAGKRERGEIKVATMGALEFTE